MFIADNSGFRVMQRVEGTEGIIMCVNVQEGQ